MATSAIKPIGLVIPTRWEARGILRQYSFARAGRLWRAQIEGRPVFLRISGVGGAAAARAADELVAAGAKALVSMGFCGALLPTQRVGDLVTDRITSAQTPTRTRQEREALALRANAVAVDMETQAVIEAGTRRGVPIRILRVISDTLDDDLRPLLGQNGHFSGFRIALRLLNPRVWPLAARLKRQSMVARQSLANTLATFLQGAA